MDMCSKPRYHGLWLVGPCVLEGGGKTTLPLVIVLLDPSAQLLYPLPLNTQFFYAIVF